MSSFRDIECGVLICAIDMKGSLSLQQNGDVGKEVTDALLLPFQQIPRTMTFSTAPVAFTMMRYRKVNSSAKADMILVVRQYDAAADVDTRPPNQSYPSRLAMLECADIGSSIIVTRISHTLPQ